MSLLQHADEKRFHMSAAGLFHVGMHLLPAVTIIGLTFQLIKAINMNLNVIFFRLQDQ